MTCFIARRAVSFSNSDQLSVYSRPLIRTFTDIITSSFGFFVLTRRLKPPVPWCSETGILTCLPRRQRKKRDRRGWTRCPRLPRRVSCCYLVIVPKRPLLQRSNRY